MTKQCIGPDNPVESNCPNIGIRSFEIKHGNSDWVPVYGKPPGRVTAVFSEPIIFETVTIKKQI